MRLFLLLLIVACKQCLLLEEGGGTKNGQCRKNDGGQAISTKFGNKQREAFSKKKKIVQRMLLTAL